MSESPQLEDGYTRIANELLEAVYRSKFSASQLSILLMVWRYTYGFQRKDHELAVSYISLHTGIHQQQVKKELSYLIDANVLKVTREATKTDSRKIAFNKNYTQWVIHERGGKNPMEQIDLFGGSEITTSEGGSKIDTSRGSKTATSGGSEITTQERKSLKKISKEIVYSRFDQFWAFYPKKVGKKDALRHFERLHKDKDFSFDDFVKGTKNYVDYCQQTNRLLKDGSAFVNQETYKDFLDMPDEQMQLEKSSKRTGNSKFERNKKLLQQKMREEGGYDQAGDTEGTFNGVRSLPNGGIE